MPRLSPETVQICQDLLPYNSFDEMVLAAQIGLSGGNRTEINGRTLYIYGPISDYHIHSLYVAVYDRGSEMSCRGTPLGSGGWTDYFSSIAEMLASHEGVIHEAEPD